MMRILQVTPYYEEAWAYGGIPRAVAETARGLVERGHQVTVCTTDVCDSRTRLRARVQIRGGVEVRLFRNLSNRTAYHLQLFLPLGLDGFLRDQLHRFDVAHLHACHSLPAAMAARRLLARGIPYALSPHGTAPLIERRQTAKRVFDLVLGRHTLPGATRVLAVSRAEARQLHQLGVEPARIDVVGNPLPPIGALPVRGRFRDRLRLRAPELVMFLGKLTPRKQVDVLLRAFARLTRPAELVIAGNDMGVRASLERLALELGIAGRTRFVGLLRGDERLEALVDADVLAYAGRDEVFGLAAAEAVLCGTPVVVADDSGCGELIAGSGGGVLVPSGDVNALARALEDLLERRPSVKEAAARLRQDFSRQSVCERIERSYEAMLRRGAGGAGARPR
jgi:glycosyltransferase involved in cell wall biosynthesis